MNEIIQRLRTNLQPKGTLPVVILRPMSSIGIVMDTDFVQKCIDEFEKINILAAIGEKPSNLEILAIQLLLDSAHIDPKKEGQE